MNEELAQVFDRLFRLFAQLPLSWLHRIGAALGRSVVVLSPVYRRHLRQNLRQAGVSDRVSVGRAAAEAGKGVLELPYLWLRPANDILSRTQTANWELVTAARARGRGIIFLTPHLGCFEVTAQYFAVNLKDGAPITVLYRPPRKAALRPIFEGVRARGNLKLAPADLGGVRRMVRALRHGEAVGLLPDQVPTRGEGVWAPFFGKAAYTMRLPAKLREITDATILLAYGERLSHARGWVIHLLPFERSLDGPPEFQAAQINAAMESLIKLCPEQYFWGYNRYKVPRGVKRPPSPL